MLETEQNGGKGPGPKLAGHDYTLQNIKKYSPKTSVIMLSSQERYGIAMQTLQKGAEQYVIKDENSFEKIAEMVEEIELASLVGGLEDGPLHPKGAGERLCRVEVQLP